MKKTDNHGSQIWFNKKKNLHREDGPAAIWPDGSQHWYKDGILHRENGPAVIYQDGSQKWYKNGKLHRDNGPAIIYSNGCKIWYIDHVFIKEKQ